MVDLVTLCGLGVLSLATLDEQCAARQGYDDNREGRGRPDVPPQ